MKRLSIDLLLAATMAVLPRVFGASPVEAGRMLILAIVYAAFSLLPERARRAAAVALAVTLLALAWFQSFPAGNHSAEIGLYLLFGALAMLAGCARGSNQLGVLGGGHATQR